MQSKKDAELLQQMFNPEAAKAREEMEDRFRSAMASAPLHWAVVRYGDDEELVRALKPLADLARYADTCELFLRETHPGKADALRDRVTAARAAFVALGMGGEHAV